MFTVLLVIIHVVVCLFLIGVVLLQQGKGSDLASAFGGGGGQAAFGARSGATFMHKLTVGAFVVFILTSVMLVIVNRQEGPSVVDEVKQEAVEEEPQGTADSQEATETQTQDTEAPSEAPAENAQPQN